VRRSTSRPAGPRGARHHWRCIDYQIDSIVITGARLQEWRDNGSFITGDHIDKRLRRLLSRLPARTPLVSIQTDSHVSHPAICVQCSVLYMRDSEVRRDSALCAMFSSWHLTAALATIVWQLGKDKNSQKRCFERCGRVYVSSGDPPCWRRETAIWRALWAAWVSENKRRTWRNSVWKQILAYLTHTLAATFPWPRAVLTGAW